MLNYKDICELCNSAVRVVSGEDGTNHYEPLDEAKALLLELVTALGDCMASDDQKLWCIACRRWSIVFRKKHLHKPDCVFVRAKKWLESQQSDKR